MIDKLKQTPDMQWSWKKLAMTWVFILISFPAIVVIIVGAAPLEVIKTLGVFFLLSATVVAPLIQWAAIWATAQNYRSFTNQIEVENLSAVSKHLQEDLDKDFFNNLVKINFKYLDKYYLQTQVQADKSFILSLLAAIVGLLIITTGITMMFFGKAEPAYVTTAAGLISEFIAAVFFYLYNKTILSMADYHKKLVITQNISLALKITAELPDEIRAKSQIAIVEALTKDVNHLLAGIYNDTAN